MEGLGNANMDRGCSAYPSKRLPYIRKRSQSPVARIPKQRPQVKKRKQPDRAAKIKFDRSDALNEEFRNDPAHAAIMKLTGPGVARKSNGKFETRAESEAKLSESDFARNVNGLQMATKDELEKRQREVNKSNITTAFEKPDVELGEIESARPEAAIDWHAPLNATCDGCKKQICGARFKCFTCPDWDYCHDCFGESQLNHPETHHFKQISTKYVKANGAHPATEETFCYCETTLTTDLVLCDCGEPFHPGCISTGDAGYTEEENYEAWRNGGNFLCDGCRAVEIKGDDQAEELGGPEQAEEEDNQAPREYQGRKNGKRTATEMEEENQEFDQEKNEGDDQDNEQEEAREESFNPLSKEHCSMARDEAERRLRRDAKKVKLTTTEMDVD